jgi:hypothetical protein
MHEHCLTVSLIHSTYLSFNLRQQIRFACQLRSKASRFPSRCFERRGEVCHLLLQRGLAIEGCFKVFLQLA